MTSDLTVRIPADRMVLRQSVRDIIAIWMRGQTTTAVAECAIARLGYSLDEAAAAMAYVKAGTE